MSQAGTTRSAAATGYGNNPLRGKYYLSLGDSYSVGYQPNIGATSGYTGYVAKKLKMTLENFGCGGATTTSILTFNGCSSPYGPPAATDAASYTTNQVDAVDAFIAEHPGMVGLVTVSIGGNDVTSCVATPDPVTCIAGRLPTIESNVTELATKLHSALAANDDSSAPLVGLTYPDVILGAWVFPTYPPSSSTESLAGLSVTAFHDYINPVLQSSYEGAGGQFVDVTTATGYLTPLMTLATLPRSTGVTDVPPGTKIPEAVVDVCQLTYFCTLGNIHANTKGYTLIGSLVTSAVS